jgi:hypothetical protein
VIPVAQWLPDQLIALILGQCQQVMSLLIALGSLLPCLLDGIGILPHQGGVTLGSGRLIASERNCGLGANGQGSRQPAPVDRWPLRFLPAPSSPAVETAKEKIHNNFEIH